MDINEFTGLSEPKKIAYLDKCRKAYYEGQELISDAIYEDLVDLLEDPQAYRDKVGEKVDGSRKRRLPVPMASMNKIKTMDEINDWAKSKGISKDVKVVIMPKFDGASLLVNVNTRQAWTRGDGQIGQDATEHFSVIPTGAKVSTFPGTYVNGEVMMPEQVFQANYAKTYKNSRNLVAGLLNSKEASPILKDCVFVAYGTDAQMDKEDVLVDLNALVNTIGCDYYIEYLKNINHTLLQDLFDKWNKIFTLDGLIIEVNDKKICECLGRETSSNNPCYARAWKGQQATTKTTTLREIINQVSKWGELRPVGVVDPVQLDGVTITRVTLKNWKNIVDMGIAVGNQVELVRSGGVIPEVLKTMGTAKVQLPVNCPSCSSPVEWDANKVHLACSNDDCETKNLQRIVSFFKHLEIDHVGEGVVEQLYEAGCTEVKHICAMRYEDFIELDGWGDKKAKTFYKNLHDKLKNVPLEKIQHASGFFKGLGSKKLALFVPFNERINNGEDVHDELLTIEGIQEKSIEAYLAGNAKFVQWVTELPVTISRAQKSINKTGDDYNNMVVVFTGFRDKDAEQQLEEKGAKIGSSVSKTTTHLIMKEKGSGSSKEKKALELGITIWNQQELEKFLGGKKTATISNQQSSTSIWEE